MEKMFVELALQATERTNRRHQAFLFERGKPALKEKTGRFYAAGTCPKTIRAKL